MIYQDGRFVTQATYDAQRRKQAEAEAKAQAKQQAIADGKYRIRARNATTHGLFARDVVLPHLGEDPQGYDALFTELTAQLKPANLLERHYTEKIAAASWRLRRLHRWQAQLFEDETLTEDERLDKLDKVLRHETALHRQIDTAVKMLSREVSRLFESRSREVALSLVQATKRDCRRDEEVDWDVARTARELRTFKPLPADFDYGALDNTRAPDPHNCQNGPSPDADASPCSEGEVARDEPEGVLAGAVPHRNCQNGPAPDADTSPCSEGEVARLAATEGVLPEGVLPEGVLPEGVLPEGVPAARVPHRNCQNEHAPVTEPSPIPMGEGGVGANPHLHPACGIMSTTQRPEADFCRNT